ncbi:MAG: glycosyltransferase family 9 protein [Gammaproteobacteria bacterium]
MIWHLPHLHSISAQCSAPVTVLTKPRSLSDRLLAADPAIKRVLWLERNPGKHDGVLGIFRLAAMLRRLNFREAWLLHGSSRYALTLLLAGIPRTIGFGRGAQRWLLSEPVFLPPERTHGHPIRLADELLSAHGIQLIEKEPALVVDDRAAAAVSARYQQCLKPWVALGIGSSEHYKQWGAANFASLVEKLRETVDARFFAVGGPADAALAESIIKECGNHVEAITKLPIDHTAALLKHCVLYIGNDTGALNLAAAVGTHAVGLFGASPPLLHSPHIKAVQPTGRAGMAGITVDAVVQAALPLLKNSLTAVQSN